MNRISGAFTGRKAFIAFVTGGDPDIEVSERIIVELAKHADIIEIGIPFSDPVAEGPVIQAADIRALASGVTTDALFGMVKRLRNVHKLTLPLLFMTYLNPVFTYGKERFLAGCVDAGIDGIIVPDMPFDEKDELAEECKNAGVTLISMIAPTSDDRIKMIAKESEGFLYCVSSAGVTGMRTTIGGAAVKMVETAKKVTNTPCAVGFGVSTPEQAEAIVKYCDGVIVGSAIVNIVAREGKNAPEAVGGFAAKMSAAVKNNT